MDEPVFITGAAGFLGGFLTAELVRRGVKTVLGVRPRGNVSPKSRVDNLFRFMELSPRVEPLVLPVDILKPDLGLSSAQRKLIEDIPVVVHCAADTSFAQRLGKVVHATNIEGLENVFRALPGCDRFFHMSTAYASGIQQGRITEELQFPSEFNNPYEQSKNHAEKVITELCSSRGTDLTIFRPSITYGHSVTGASLRFNALYYPVRTFLFLRDSLRRDILERGGKRASVLGASLGSDGKLRLPVSLPGEGWLNLIPVDYLVDSVIIIMESGATGIFHLVNPRSCTVEGITGYLMEHYLISGIGISNGIPSDGALQALVNRYMDVYYPYFCDTRVFDDSRSAEVLRPAGIDCPEFNGRIFRKCMDFAIENGWGDKIEI